MKDDRLYLTHILERIAWINDFTKSGQDDFKGSLLTQEAVLRCLEIIGEAARKLSDELRVKYSEVPWKQIIAVRNILIHSYDTVNLEVVWHIIENDLPPLKEQAEKMLADLDQQSETDNP